jgi:hypothetical protein
MHGVVNHVILRQREFSLAKPKLALSIDTFYSHTLVCLRRVTKRTYLSMRLNLQVF